MADILDFGKYARKPDPIDRRPFTPADFCWLDGVIQNALHLRHGSQRKALQLLTESAQAAAKKLHLLERDTDDDRLLSLVVECWGTPFLSSPETTEEQPA